MGWSILETKDIRWSRCAWEVHGRFFCVRLQKNLGTNLVNLVHPWLQMTQETLVCCLREAGIWQLEGTWRLASKALVFEPSFVSLGWARHPATPGSFSICTGAFVGAQMFDSHDQCAYVYSEKTKQRLCWGVKLSFTLFIDCLDWLRHTKPTTWFFFLFEKLTHP